MPSALVTAATAGAVSVTAELAMHVHKRVERFVYRDNLAASDVPVAYLESPLPTPRQLVSLIDDGAGKDFAWSRSSIDVFTGKTYSSRKPIIEATNKFVLDAHGNREPLWYKHKLRPGTTSVTVRKTSSGEIPEYSGIQVAIDELAIYTNYRNYFNPETGAWLIYWVDCSYGPDGGFETSVMLQPQPVVTPGVWQDLDLNTGLYPPTLVVYDRAISGSGYEYTFNVSDTYWVRDAAANALTAKLPANQALDSSWFLRIQAGTVFRNGKKYSITEWGSQPFTPSAPYRRATNHLVTRVNDIVFYIGRRGLEGETDSIWIYGYDTNDQLAAVYTTDGSVSPGTEYNGVAIEVLRQGGADSDSGFVWTDVGMKPEWTYYTDFTYTASDFDLENLELNPLLNPNIREGSYVVYCIPDLPDGETSIHWAYLKDGIVTDTSQGPGGSYPNLQLTDAFGVYNPDTIIGLTAAELSSLLGGDNLLICIVGLKNIPELEKVFAVDVRRSGPQLGVDAAELFKYNPRALYTDIGYGLHGQSVPGAGAIIVDVPIDVLESHGGLLTADSVRTELERFLPATSYVVINWTYPKPELVIKTETSGTVGVTARFDGDGVYKLLRRDNENSPWTQLNTFTPVSDADIVFSDTTPTSGKRYYYAVQVDTYPVGNQTRVEVM